MTTPLRLGLLSPMTGIVGMYGAEIRRAAQIAVDMVNESGGVRGRPLQLIVEDDGSLPESAVKAAERLVAAGSSALIGNVLSSSRIAVAYQVAEPRRIPLLNFSSHEGSIVSRYFFHFAALPNQQIEPALAFACARLGGRVYFAGNAFEWPRGSIAAAIDALTRAGGEVVGEEYLPLGCEGAALDALVDRVAAARPEIFVAFFAGGDQVELLRRVVARGLKSRMAVFVAHFDEVMAAALEPEARGGIFSVAPYFMGVDTPANRRLLARLAAAPGVHGVWPAGDGVISSFGEGAHVCVQAFAAAAERAGEGGAAALLDALSCVEVDAPQGRVQMRPKIQHAAVSARIARCRSDGAFEIVEAFEAIEPSLPGRYRHERIEPRTTLEDETRLRARILSQIGEAVVLLGAAEGAVVYNNAAAERLFGCGEGSLVGRRLVPSDGVEAMAPRLGTAEVGRALLCRGSWRGDASAVRCDGGLVWCAVTASAFTHPFYGEVWLLVLRDLSDRVHPTRDLFRDRDLATLVLETSLNGVAIADASGALRYVNPAFLRLWGHTAESEVLGRSSLSFWEDPSEAAAVVAALHRDGAWRGELTARRVDGEVRAFEVSANSVVDDDGVVIAMMASFVDATERVRAEQERRRAEERTRASEARYQRAERGTNDGLWEWHIATGEEFFSTRWCAILGYRKGELRERVETFAELVHPEDRSSVWAAVERHRGAGEPFDLEFRMRRRDGEYLWVRSRGHVESTEAGEEVMTGSISDVSRQRKAEARLLEAHRIAGLGAWELDLVTGEPWWSPQQYAINGVEPETRLTQEFFLQLIHPADRGAFDASFRRLFEEEGVAIDYRIVRPDGEIRNMHGVATVTRDASGRPIRLSGTNLDVTARVQAESTIRRALAEKETLLREIHHRVKNNLQIVGGYLHFHAKKLASVADARVLAELRQRIDGMSMIHERLYRSHDLAGVDFGDHARALVSAILRTNDHPEALEVAVEADDVRLPIEVAMPASMILCELITNVIKYAFPGGDGGRARVRLGQRGNAVQLAVEDDGVGLPAGFDPWRSPSFGWTLVRSLVEQLDGTFEVECEAGTPGLRVRVTFALGERA